MRLLFDLVKITNNELSIHPITLVVVVVVTSNYVNKVAVNLYHITYSKG